MTLTKQELLDWINEELADESIVHFIATEVGEETTVDDLFVDRYDLTDDELADYSIEDTPASHVIFLA